MCPCSLGQIQTSVQAGGTARERMRRTASREVMRLPSGCRYAKPEPFRRRVIPGLSSVTYRRPTESAPVFGSLLAGAASLHPECLVIDIDGSKVPLVLSKAVMCSVG